MPATELASAATPAVTPLSASVESLTAPPDINLPQFVRGVREFYLGMLHGHLQPPQFDSVRSIDAAWLVNLVLKSQGEPLPATPQVDITVTEMEAFQRFCDCAEDNEGFDVDKDMMRRLADIGLVRSQGFGRYCATAYGDAVRATR